MFCKVCKRQYQNSHNQQLCLKHLQHFTAIYQKGKTDGWHTVIDFTMTACNRVELIEPTCKSLQSKLQDLDITKATIYCNVDPLLTQDTEDNVKTCLEKYFKTVIVNKPNRPSFAKAVKWCWTQSKKPLIFHTEDDWEFLKPFKIENLFKMMIPYNFVSSVQLYKGEQDKGIVGLIRLSPSLHKSEFVAQMAKRMNSNENPEGQLRHNKQWHTAGGVALYTGLCYKPGDRYIQDTGITWRNKKGIKHSTFFNHWNVSHIMR